jgi:hypothetical protein
VARDAAEDELVRQDVDDVGGVQLAIDPDHQALAGELVDQIEHAVLPSVVGSVLDEVIGPDMVRMLRPQTDTAPVVQPEPPLFGCFCGTLSPSRRHVRSTRLAFTAHPAPRSIAVMRR